MATVSAPLATVYRPLTNVLTAVYKLLTAVYKPLTTVEHPLTAVYKPLNVIARRQDKEKAALEKKVFWLRYYYRWEMQDVARKVKKSKPWVEKMCQIVEATVEAFFLSQNAA
ncbi:hypothetical protein [uncultured Microbulbifer sp.]|uniref:hypothetical protein n=1 Tax=uncultured Microbulbifer sp. TaxID=348147 RepID=UPI0026093F2D|nr:hypothetical protein [uncultured Microbulbifer sp.]